jgi:hypothetical protein
MFVSFFWPGVAWVGFGIEGPIVLGVGSWGVTDIAVDACPNFLHSLPSMGKSHHGGGSSSRSPANTFYLYKYVSRIFIIINIISNSKKFMHIIGLTRRNQ